MRVESKVLQKPRIVKNKVMRDVNGNVIAKATGVEGKLVDTVKVNGKPAPGVAVTETNQNSDTKNGTSVSSTTVEGKASTNANGQVADVIGIYHPTSGSKAENKAIIHDFTGNVWTLTGMQTLTLTLPNGVVCSATSLRTLTNAGSDGTPNRTYTLTPTQPVVESPGH